jgi:O-antigen/teichoic acid export membrane protein
MRAELSLRKSAFLLALSGGIEYGLQLIIPIILVRYIDPATFGQYRFLWIMSGTVLAFAPAFMPQALFYFLPRADLGTRQVLIGNVLVYLIAASGFVFIFTSRLNPLLPAMAKEMFFDTYGISTMFLSLWVVASLLDVLPTAEGKADWQFHAVIFLAVMRTLLLAGAAITSSQLIWLVGVMLAVAVMKLVLLAYYIRSQHEKIGWQIMGIKKQLAYSLPFAVGNTLFLLRMQADQWVVASMLTHAQYAIFSIAAVLMPVATLIRQPVNNAMMPELNRAHMRADFSIVSRLIAKTNGATALFLLPISGGLFVMATELISIVYTCQYCEAAPIMRVYLIGMMLGAFAVGHVLPALEKSRFAMINSGVCLGLSVFLSIVGVNRFGMIGAALGSVLTFGVSELWSVYAVSRSLGIRMHQLVAWEALWSTLLSTAIAVAGVTLLGNAISGTPFHLLFVKGLSYATLFTLCFLLSGGHRQGRALMA